MARKKIVEREIPLAWRKKAERERDLDLLGVLREPSAPYWLTRSRREGVLSEHVEIWTVLPERYAYQDGDVEWFAPAEFLDIEDVTTYVGSWSVSEARQIAGVCPDTAVECVRVGREIN